MSRSPLILELLRKSIHLSSLFIVVGYTVILNYFGHRVAVLVVTALLLILLEIEYFRLEHRPKLMVMFNDLFRRHEHNSLSGAVFLVISCVICFAAFDYWVAVLALFMTVFGDLAAALFGRCFGKTKILGDKTFIGTLAGFAANMVVGALALPEFLLLITSMSIVATFTELLTNKLDDNLTVPLFAGFTGQMVVYFFILELPPEFTFLGFF
ncbi:hypothetical protein HN709_02410 [Candidatus Peregrinibacteria bacterium]|jgi:phytol kinase|nr:hypothetical protein [Candidatus Peregrinibacteria bacterium]MBT7736515.1 hypothetical protein [Candidatus Peregrinibacteria bacterium]